jgi:PKD repeat protein
MRKIKLQIFLLLLFFVSYQTIAQELQRIELRPGPENGYDGEVRTDMNYPIWYEDDFIANAWTVSGNPFIQRSLIRFDLSAIPEGAEITSAKLSLFCNTISGHHQLHYGFNSSYLLMITSDWDQYQVTWSSQPTTTYENSVLLPQSDYQTQDYLNIDLTSQIDYFYRNPSHNYGFMLQLSEEQLYAALVFASSNHINPEKRPLLVIDYIPCEKPDTNFSYTLGENLTTVNFTVAPDPNTSYWWDFGNGYYSDLPQPVFAYQHTGKYNVCLTVSNTCDTLTNCDSVNVCNIPNALFDYHIQDHMVLFSPKQIIDGDQYLWNFGDGFLSYLAEPLHYYVENGNYLVCLTVTNSCNSVQFCDTVEFEITGIEKKGLADLISISPNPTNGLVQIRKLSEQLTLYKMIVLSIDGKVVLVMDADTMVNNPNDIRCDLSGLTSGMYSLIFETNKGLINRKVVLIAKN